MLGKKVASLTSHNVAKIMGPYEIKFGSKTHRLEEICKKTFFSNFVISTGHIGHIFHPEPLKFCMDHLFVPNQQISKKNAKSIKSQEHFIIMPYSRPCVNMAHPVLGQNCPKHIQKTILTCSMNILKGDDILMKIGDFF